MRKVGSFYLSGCTFWIIVSLTIVLIISLPFLLPILNAAEDNAAARRAKEQAVKAQAEAARIQAEGQAQAVRIQAEAQADVLRMYTEAGVNAIETDRKRAHPETLVSETLVKVLVVISLPTCLALVTLATIYYKDPKTGRRIINALSALRPKRIPKVDGEYRDGGAQGNIVNL